MPHPFLFFYIYSTFFIVMSVFSACRLSVVCCAEMRISSTTMVWVFAYAAGREKVGTVVQRVWRNPRWHVVCYDLSMLV